MRHHTNIGCARQCKKSKKSNEEENKVQNVEHANEGESSGDVPAENTATKQDVVECSLCSKWMKAGPAGVDGISFREIGEMEVYCMPCVYNGMSGMKSVMQGYARRIIALEETVKTLSLLVQDNVETRQGKMTSTENHMQTSHSAGTYAAAVANSQVNAIDCEQILKADEQTVDKETYVTLPSEDDQSSSQRRTNDGVFQVVQRRNKEKKKKINIVGDSIASSITKVVKCNEQGSSCTSLRGAGIKQIVERCELMSDEVENDSLMVIQGGGNSLRWLGEETTVKSIMDSVKKIKGKKKDLKIAVVSVLPRPRENYQYDELRKTTNRHLQSELCKMKAELMKDKEGGVSFIDVDKVLTPKMFMQDGVHLNHEGSIQLGKRVLTWVKENSRVQPVGRGG